MNFERIPFKKNMGLKRTPFKKNMRGRFILEVELPIEFQIDAMHEVYVDEYGNQYHEDDYTYGVNEALEGLNSEDKAKVRNILSALKDAGFTIAKEEIEEC